MLRHEHFSSMLLWQDELSPDDRARLSRHLDDCAECRTVASLYAENRARLRALAGIRPPADLHASIVSATERAELGFYVPVLFMYLAIPMSLLAAVSIFTYGLMASVWFLFGLLLLSVLITWQGYQRDAGREMPLHGDPGARFRPLARMVAVDLLGVVLGVSLFALLVLGFVVASGHRFS